MFNKMKQWLGGAEVSIVHQFMKPPYGGGNQFLLALKNELALQGLEVNANKIGYRTKNVLFNSFNFDMDKLRLQLSSKRRLHMKTIHRVDGPISAYRGNGLEIDQAIFNVNRELADVSVFQSYFSLNKHLELGLDFGKNVHVITNAVNPTYFYPKVEKPSFQGGGGVVKIIASSWSSNPRKGLETFKWLDKNLNFNNYQMTFIGNINANLENIKVLPAAPSAEVGVALREHDIYITASLNDPCSNALIEALSCGLPALYKKSGGHAEIVKGAGLGFDENEEIPTLLEKMVQGYNDYRKSIKVPTISEVAKQYRSLFQ